jgi:hypothetical protein
MCFVLGLSVVPFKLFSRMVQRETFASKNWSQAATQQMAYNYLLKIYIRYTGLSLQKKRIPLVSPLIFVTFLLT